MLIGQIGLVKTPGFWGWLIRTITRSETNHVVIWVNGTQCVSAQPGGVAVTQITDWPAIVWSDFPISDVAGKEITDFALSQVGKPYAYLDDLFIGIALLTRTHTPKWLERRLSSGDQWQCAALGDAALQHGGIHVFDDDRPYGAVFPGSFEHAFRDFGWLPKGF